VTYFAGAKMTIFRGPTITDTKDSSRPLDRRPGFAGEDHCSRAGACAQRASDAMGASALDCDLCCARRQDGWREEDSCPCATARRTARSGAEKGVAIGFTERHYAAPASTDSRQRRFSTQKCELA
jgi:hypothetical protein